MEGDKGLQTDAGLLVLELLECAEGVGVDVEFEHVEDFVGEGACEGEAVRTLLRVEGQEEEGSVVFEGEEFECCVVVSAEIMRMDHVHAWWKTYTKHHRTDGCRSSW